MKKHILDLPIDQLLETVTEMGLEKYRARQIYQWLYNKKVQSFDSMTNLSKEVRRTLSEQYDLFVLEPVRNLKSNECDTSKYLFKTRDGHYIESVLIPEKDRRTLCISSQVGCSLDCKFCATGMMGFYRNLTAGEIIEQVIRSEAIAGEKITNIVFMGMGEPFLNYDRVMNVCRVLADPEGMAIKRRRITISTSGIIPKIIQLAEENHPVGLAISLHAPNQEIREQIMPIARKFPFNELMESIYYYYQKTKRRPTYEYILIRGLNDQVEHAKILRKILSRTPAKINLIPYNDVGAGFQASTPEQIDRFIRILLDSPITVTLRKSRGSDIQAACGQLSTKYMMKQESEIIQR
jgi:23S rRNA (adenine2503-C2)-methyltransferase